MTAPARTSEPSTWRWLAALLLLGVALRWVAFAGYPAQSYPDTGTYFRAAAELISGDFSVGQGRRTPGYPLVIALAGLSSGGVVALQWAAGIATSLMLFALVRLVGGSPALAFVAGASYNLNLQQLYQEADLLTETFSTFSVAATLVALACTIRRLRQGRSAWGLLVLTGVAGGYAVMVRPQFVVFGIVVPLALIWAQGGWRWPTWRSVAVAAVGTLPIVLIVLAWCAVVWVKVGYFTMSTQSGFGMVNHPIDYIEQAPAPYEKVRDILVRTRDARIAEVGHSRNTIWYAWPEIQRATGWTLPEASRHFQRMCTQMFAADPMRYAVSVAHAWYDFWAVPIFWEPGQIRPPWLGAWLDKVWSWQMWALRLFNLAFVGLVALVLAWPRARRGTGWGIELTAVAAVVLMSSVVQALADQGASARYAIPTQAAVVVVVVVAAWRWWSARRDAVAPDHGSGAT